MNCHPTFMRLLDISGKPLPLIINRCQMIKSKRTARSKWILIGVGLLSFLTMMIYLVDILTSQEVSSIADLVENVLHSFPFVIMIAYIDYQLVKYIYKTHWLCNNLIPRILFEFTALSVLAIIFVQIGSLPFKYNGNLVVYIHSMLYIKTIMPAILMNTFTITIIEFFVQNQQSSEREIEFERLQTDNLKMQYQQLKGQINPHFLFNSLNAMVSLINKDPQRATIYTKKLSEVYRYVLTHDMEDSVKVSDEMEFIRNYIAILDIRFEKGLRVEIDVRKQDYERNIPPMALQVLVENAVKHNVVSASKPLHVTISSDGNYLIASNNISPRLRVETSTGIGLKNLSGKCKITTGKDIIINDNRSQFTVKIPLSCK